MMDQAKEFNFDGLVGPTHNYSGLSLGNVASGLSKGDIANPKLAALQGIQKMRELFNLGLAQAVLAPQERPDVYTLRQLGFNGNDKQVIAKVAQQAPGLLASCYSASSMWTANAATISPSADCDDHRLHITPANLCSHLHRSIEAPTTARILKQIFADEAHFMHHEPLPYHPYFGDEGAANHSRFCHHIDSAGLEMFVYGRDYQASTDNGSTPYPTKFPARQSMQTGQAITRLHQLKHSLHVQQNPQVIDAGVFHNDVIAVAHQHILFAHEQAYVNQPRVVDNIRQFLGEHHQTDLNYIQVDSTQVSVEQAIKTYLFNSQILSLNDGTSMLLVPQECKESKTVWHYLQSLLKDKRFDHIKVMDLRESMKNGGGPACLRLRVALTVEQQNALGANVVITSQLLDQLESWINSHYRDRLAPNDLSDPALLDESRGALDELSQLLQLGSIYRFQQH